MAHVFRFFTPRGADPHPGGQVALDADDARRLASVLRLRTGEPIELADGAGRVFAATVEDPRAGTVRVGEELPPEPPLGAVRVLLAQSGPRAGDAVEKLVELGVREIAPLDAAGRRREERIDRWERIARGAAMQAKLPVVPAIGAPVAFEEALGPDAIVCSHEEPDGELATILAGWTRPVALLIGPEAGFSPDELALARAAGSPLATLGPTVLRSETAAIVGAAIALGALRAASLRA